MRKWFLLVAASSIVLGVAGLANAAPLNWEGSTTVIIADAPEVVVTGGGVATVNASAGVVPAHLNTLRLEASRGNIVGNATVLMTDPDTAANGVAAIVVDATFGTGTFAPISGGAASTPLLTRSTLPMHGVAKICILSSACNNFLELPLTGPTTVNGEPGTDIKGVGVGGILTAGGYGGIRISLQGAPWTIKTTTVIDQITMPGGTRTFIYPTARGWAHDPASTTTTTAQPSGAVQLVSPAQIQTNLPLGSSDKMSGLVILAVHFIPEPGALLLLASGALGLALLGRRRARA